MYNLNFAGKTDNYIPFSKLDFNHVLRDLYTFDVVYWSLPSF